MNELIELNIDTPDGLADCRLELQENEKGYYYEATILYPHIINGFSRSEIYCYNFIPTGKGQYQVEETEEKRLQIRCHGTPFGSGFCNLAVLYQFAE
jgi:hypothetical protein